ncbi:MAG: hypothetical protein L6282_07010 [Candidatus Methanoperedenaceae archaeon]|nr:hypothetical protein [Candidatus Methanoperedenaceae archaeon]
MSMEGGRMSEIGEMLQQRHGTRMTRIGRIFTDIFNPWVSASSAQSVFYRIPPIIYDDKKPQMNADERRYVHEAGFGKRIHRKGRKERKAAHQESLCPLRSLWLNVFSAPAPERAPPALAVHPRSSCAGG